MLKCWAWEKREGHPPLNWPKRKEKEGLHKSTECGGSKYSHLPSEDEKKKTEKGARNGVQWQVAPPWILRGKTGISRVYGQEQGHGWERLRSFMPFIGMWCDIQYGDVASVRISAVHRAEKGSDRFALPGPVTPHWWVRLHLWELYFKRNTDALGQTLRQM